MNGMQNMEAGKAGAVKGVKERDLLHCQGERK